MESVRSASSCRSGVGDLNGGCLRERRDASPTWEVHFDAGEL